METREEYIAKLERQADLAALEERVDAISIEGKQERLDLLKDVVKDLLVLLAKE